jgi:hypothetical protein
LVHGHVSVAGECRADGGSSLCPQGGEVVHVCPWLHIRVCIGKVDVIHLIREGGDATSWEMRRRGRRRGGAAAAALIETEVRRRAV